MSSYFKSDNVNSLLKTFDVGGVNPSHTVEGQGTKFKSVFGGIISTAMVILSLCYTSYVCQLYYNNKLTPKSQTSQKTISYQEVVFDYNIITFIFASQSELVQPNPFDQSKIILIPNIRVVRDVTIIKTGQLLPETVKDSFDQKNYTVLNLQQNNETDITLIHDQAFYTNETQIAVTFLKCIPYLLQPNQSCATQSEMDEFFAIPLKIVIMRVNFKQYSLENLDFELTTKSYYFLFDETQTLYTQIILRTKQMTVENLMPFRNKLNQTFVSSVEIQPETVSKDYFKRYFFVEGYANFLIRLDSLQEFETLSYPNYGEVLAQISPVIHIIFWMKIIVSFYNSRQYQNKLVSLIMSQTLVPTQIQTKQQNQQLNEEKLQALSRMNIFNIHLELYQMRQILDQIMAKNGQYHPKIEPDPSLIHHDQHQNHPDQESPQFDIWPINGQEQKHSKMDPESNLIVQNLHQHDPQKYVNLDQPQFESNQNDQFNVFQSSYLVYPPIIHNEDDNQIIEVDSINEQEYRSQNQLLNNKQNSQIKPTEKQSFELQALESQNVGINDQQGNFKHKHKFKNQDNKQNLDKQVLYFF